MKRRAFLRFAARRPSYHGTTNELPTTTDIGSFGGAHTNGG